MSLDPGPGNVLAGAVDDDRFWALIDEAVRASESAAERFAAQELAEHLGNISGVHIRILRPAQAQGIKHIAVGYYAAAAAGRGTKSDSRRGLLPFWCGRRRVSTFLGILGCGRAPRPRDHDGAVEGL